MYGAALSLLSHQVNEMTLAWMRKLKGDGHCPRLRLKNKAGNSSKDDDSTRPASKARLRQ